MAFFGLVAWDPIRVIAHGSIASTYAALGGPLAHPVRSGTFTNTTDADMYLSTDGVNDMIVAPAAGPTYLTRDLSTNRDGGVNETFKIGIGTQFYVRYISGAPSKGSVYLECIYAQGE